MISLKRSRDSSSCILADDKADRQLPPPEMRRSRCADRLPAILTVWSQDTENEKEKESDRGQMGDFLEQCSFCKKRLSLNDPLFMYGYLGAFCSPECRGKQIAYDKLVDLCKRIQSMKRRTFSSKMNDAEDQTTAKPERRTLPSPPQRQFHI